MKNIISVLVFMLILGSCNTNVAQNKAKEISDLQVNAVELPYDTSLRTAHILVALCDNKYQGIVPVPAKIGNGQDPGNNLYWGAMYGIKTFFSRSKDWQLVRKQKINDTILERLVFKHKATNMYLIADAYDGQFIKNTTSDFLYSASGQLKDTLIVDNKVIGINGNANLISYVGHDGLMDFTLDDVFQNEDQKQRDVIILACYSKRFFNPLLQDCKVNPVVWSSHLMAPEAYIMHAALDGYAQKETNEQIRSRAAAAYSKYQKCSLKAARNLLVTGW